MDRSVRIAVMALALLTVAWAASMRPDYLDPTQLGTDVSTYYGAGERLLAGGDLYALAAGDRPVHIRPPYWTVPLVSPPPIGALWTLAALLPPAITMVGWWLGAMAVTLGAVALVVLRGPLLASLMAVPLLLAIAVTCWTGNVNGYLLGAAVVVWGFGRRSGWMSAALVGIVTAVAIGVKIGPLLLLVWLVGQRRWATVAAAIGAGLGLLLLTVLVAGPSSFADYVDVARAASVAAPSSLGAAGFARAIGFSEDLARWAPGAVAIGCVVAVLATRRRARLSFAIAGAGAVLALPAVRYESLALLLAAFIPWSMDQMAGTLTSFAHSRRRAALGGGALIALALVGAVGLAAARTSGMWITNEGSAPVVVRIYFNGIPESFGFAVAPGVTAHAWGPTMGAVAGPLVVYSADCRQLSVSKVPASGGWLTVRVDGSQRLVPDPGALIGPLLAFEPTCAESAP